MNTYIASFVNKKDECWDCFFYADNYKKALKESRALQKTLGKLVFVRRFQGNVEDFDNQRLSDRFKDL